MPRSRPLVTLPSVLPASWRQRSQCCATSSVQSFRRSAKISKNATLLNLPYVLSIVTLTKRSDLVNLCQQLTMFWSSAKLLLRRRVPTISLEQSPVRVVQRNFKVASTMVRYDQFSNIAKYCPLPQKIALMIDPCHTWDVQYNARSNRNHSNITKI